MTDPERDDDQPETAMAGHLAPLEDVGDAVHGAGLGIVLQCVLEQSHRASTE